MRKLKLILTFCIGFLILASCDKDKKDDDVIDKLPATAKMAKNIFAYDGNKIAKFSFAKGEIVTDDSWDIAFLTTNILVNGGEKVGGEFKSFSEKVLQEPSRTGEGSLALVSGIFNDIKTVPDNADFKQDGPGKKALASGSGNGWFSYSTDTHIVSSITGKVIIVKTHDGHYAKMEIISYYKDAREPVKQDPNSGYYTFRYVYNSVKGDKSFQ